MSEKIAALRKRILDHRRPNDAHEGYAQEVHDAIDELMQIGSAEAMAVVKTVPLRRSEPTPAPKQETD